MHKIIHPSVMQAMVIVNINGYESWDYFYPIINIY